MNRYKIVKDIFESHLKKNNYFDASIFYYLAGRFPDLTIKECVDIAEQVQKEAGLI